MTSESHRQKTGTKGWCGGEASSHHHPPSLHRSKTNLDLKGKRMTGALERVQRKSVVFRERNDHYVYVEDTY
jgi:hypothetical protein